LSSNDSFGAISSFLSSMRFTEVLTSSEGSCSFSDGYWTGIDSSAFSSDSSESEEDSLLLVIVG
jgi:hypothetical protein